VTTDPEVSTVLTHILRDTLYSIIEHDPASTASNAETIWHFGNRLNKVGYKGSLISVDKTTATDTFDLDLVEAIYDGVADGSDPARKRILTALRPFCVQERRYLVPDYRTGATTFTAQDAQAWFNGQRRVAKEGFFEVKPSETKAIAPMGAPTTYSLLTIWSRFEADWSQRDRSLWKQLPRLRPTKDPLMKVQGDDVVMVGGNRRDKRYRTVCRQTGTIIGDGSHFVSKRFATFCEEPLVRDPKGQWGHRDLIKIRVLCGLNCRKDPTLPAGQKDPLITRGSAVNQVLRYAGPETRQAAMASLDRTTDRLPRLRKGRINHWKWLYVPTNLGGLGYPSTRSDKRIWRKWVPKEVKRIMNVCLSPNEAMETVLMSGHLNSTGWVSKKNFETRQDLLVDLLKDLPKASETRKRDLTHALDSPSEWSQRGTQNELGLLTERDLTQLCVDQKPSWAQWLGPDRDGRLPGQPGWVGRRNLLRSIQHKTNWMTLKDLVADLETDDSVRALLVQAGRKKLPYYGLPEYDRLRPRRIRDTKSRFPPARLFGTPDIRFKDFADLTSRLLAQTSTLWVHKSYTLVSDLLSRSRNLRVSG